MLKEKEVIAIIPARAGSKRCPSKNTRLICGKPLVTWTIEAALKAKHVDRILVTTDDSNVLNISKQYQNVISIDRPAHLATDQATSLDVVLHALDTVSKKNGLGILLQPTSPLRTALDIDASIELCRTSRCKAAISLTELPKPSNFYYGCDSLEQLSNLGQYDKIYQANGAIYLFDIENLQETNSFTDTSTLPYIMPEFRSIDIDTEEDFALAENLLRALL